VPLRILNIDPKDAFKGLEAAYDPYHFRNFGAKTICDLRLQFGEIWVDNRAALLTFFNANSIDADLQRQAILQESLEAFKIALLPIQSFSTVYSNVPLEGDDTVTVPYFPLQGNASTSFDKTTGYATVQDWTEQSRKIAVGGDGDLTKSGDNAAVGTARDRKFIGVKWGSYDASRQPFLNLVKLASQAANKLAVDIYTDIVSKVITAANFGAALKSMPPAAFSADDIAELAESATGFNWPVSQRSLTLAHTYLTPLLKDPTFKQYLAYGSTDPITKAKIQEAYGFADINPVPNLGNYSPAGEHLVGWINHSSGVLVAIAQVYPTPEVRKLLGRFDVAIDPQSGLSLAYRRFGDTNLDTSKAFIESSYGAAIGVETALKRLTSQ